MVNHSAGKIYFLWSDQSDMFYIGSTTVALNRRLGKHISDMKAKASTTYEKMQGHTNIKIELIENFPCNSKEELHAREGHFIRLHRDKLLNKQIAGRTLREYYEENRDEILTKKREYCKEYCENHRDEKKEYDHL